MYIVCVKHKSGLMPYLTDGGRGVVVPTQRDVDKIAHSAENIRIQKEAGARIVGLLAINARGTSNVNGR
jgi:hypothetical protein